MLEIFLGLYIFMLAAFVGYGVIKGVPALLHTPLMAFTNADLRHLPGWLPGRGRRSLQQREHRARRDRRALRDDQRRRWLLDHGPHAADVQEAGPEG